MGINPFETLPMDHFFNRMLKPCAAVFVVLFISVGFVANDPLFNNEKPWLLLKRSIANNPDEIEVNEATNMKNAPGPHIALKDFYFRQVDYVFHFPVRCFTGATVNEYQEKRCRIFKERFQWEVVLATFPLVGTVFFFLFLQTLLMGAYNRAKKKIKSGEALFTGIVTDPPDLPDDTLCKWYCLKAYSVQKNPKEQVTIYIPIHAPKPEAGQKMAVFDWGMHFGQKRLIGVIYAPHVAIFSGIRTR